MEVFLVNARLLSKFSLSIVNFVMRKEIVVCRQTKEDVDISYLNILSVRLMFFSSFRFFLFHFLCELRGGERVGKFQTICHMWPPSDSSRSMYDSVSRMVPWILFLNSFFLRLVFFLVILCCLLVSSDVYFLIFLFLFLFCSSCDFVVSF